MFYFIEELKNMTSTKWGSKEDGNNRRRWKERLQGLRKQIDKQNHDRTKSITKH